MRKSALRSITRLPPATKALAYAAAAPCGSARKNSSMSLAASAAASESLKTSPRSTPRTAGITADKRFPAWLRDVTAASCTEGCASSNLTKTSPE